MGIVPFLIATGIGQLPATLIYSYVGGMLTGGTKLFVTGLLILFALSGLVVLIKRIYNETQQFMKGFDCSQVVCDTLRILEELF